MESKIKRLSEDLALISGDWSKLVLLRAFAREMVDANDDAWIERAGRYFDGVREPRGLLEHWAPGSLIADIVMHEVWKRDPDVTALESALLASQESEKRKTQQLVETEAVVDRLEGSARSLAETLRKIRDLHTPNKFGDCDKCGNDNLNGEKNWPCETDIIARDTLLGNQ